MALNQTKPILTAGFVPRPDDAIDLSSLGRVLVIMLRHHGDVLLTTPVYAALRACAPQVEIDALIYRETLPMLEFSPHLAQVHCIDRTWKRQGLGTQIANEWRLLRTLAARRYDLVIHLTNHPRGAWLVRLLKSGRFKPRWSVAPKLREPSRLWNGSFSHLYSNSSSVGSGSPLGRRHVAEQNLDALRRLGISIGPAPPLKMVPGVDGERDADNYLKRHSVDGDFIFVQPTSRWLFKCWSVERNAELLSALLERGETIVLGCAPDTRERAMIRAIVDALCVGSNAALPENFKLADDGGTLNRLAALIGRAKLFIGIDSAPMHIAAAMGTPIVALFGPSGEANWGPWHGGSQFESEASPRSRVITSAAYACRPCGQDGCGGSKVSDCLTTLPVAQVLRAVDDLLRDASSTRASVRVSPQRAGADRAAP